MDEHVHLRDRAVNATRGPRRGQALTEFVLVLPVLLLLTLAIIDVGRAIFTYSVIADAAREGARYAIVHGNLATADGEQASGPTTTDPTGVNVVNAAEADAYGLNSADMKVGVCWGYGCVINPDCSSSKDSADSPSANIPVTVRVCYGFQAVTASFLQIKSIPLSAQATLTITH